MSHVLKDLITEFILPYVRALDLTRKIYPGCVDVFRRRVSGVRLQIDNVGVEGNHVRISVPPQVPLRLGNIFGLHGVDVALDKCLKFFVLPFMFILEGGWYINKPKSHNISNLERGRHVQILVDILVFIDDDVRGRGVSLDGVNQDVPPLEDQQA